MNSLHQLATFTPGLLLGTLLFLPQASLAGRSAHPPHQPNPQIAQAQPQQMPVLGVIKSRENTSQWQAITERLDATGLTYRVIDWQDVQRSTDFGDVTLLFLPNLETIASEQLLGLQAWLNRGGGLIVSGAVGSQSSAGIQNALRSLLGAYWAADLSQPESVVPLQLASQRWVRQADAGSTVIGGTLVPTSLASQPVAVWNQAGPSRGGASTSAAVVVTQKTTFLGWRWGDQTASLAEFDQSWLRAAVSRFSTLLPLRTTPASRPVGSSVPTPIASPALPPSPLPTQTPLASAPAQRPIQPEPQPEPQPVAQSAPPVDITQLRQRPAASAQSLVQPSLSQDPAEQMTPADLDVEHSPRITLYEADLMQQELENLIGRYESAVILASSRDGSPTQQASNHQSNHQAGGQFVAIRSVSNSDSEAARPLGDVVLTEARQGYSSFTTAMGQHDYALARQQWLATRQLLWDNFPLDRPLSQPEVRAIWLDRGTIVRAGSRQGLARLFDRLTAAGINTVFFETVNAGYPIYPSQVAPAQNPLTRGWDPLAEAVDLAHQRGMELHAWVWAFAAGNQAHNAILHQPASYPGPILAAHPGWANYDNRGSLIPPGQKKPFLDPANPEVRQYLLSLFEEIVSRYDVDGLQLDYIRYPFQDPRPGGHTYGYGMAARQQFQQQTGVDPITLSPSDPTQQQLWQQWTEFRIDQISSFVAETSEHLHQLNPNLILSTAVFALPERRRLNEIQQDWAHWAQQGNVDMIVLMSYAGDTNSLQRLTNPWLSRDANLGAALVLPGIRLLNLSDETVVDQIQALRDSSSGGYALFAAENLDETLQEIFRQTQGEPASTQPIPYRDPFATAASRYEVLMQQWSWLIQQGELQMRDSQIQAWQAKTTALDQALQTLADSPSEANLRQAATLLKSFQGQFKSWMEMPTLSADYRIRTWQNQLATIDKLLNYGEQVVLVRQSTTQTAGR